MYANGATAFLVGSTGEARARSVWRSLGTAGGVVAEGDVLRVTLWRRARGRIHRPLPAGSRGPPCGRRSAASTRATWSPAPRGLCRRRGRGGRAAPARPRRGRHRQPGARQRRPPVVLGGRRLGVPAPGGRNGGAVRALPERAHRRIATPAPWLRPPCCPWKSPSAAVDAPGCARYHSTERPAERNPAAGRENPRTCPHSPGATCSSARRAASRSPRPGRRGFPALAQSGRPGVTHGVQSGDVNRGFGRPLERARPAPPGCG
jgi:hypothetical protein